MRRATLLGLAVAIVLAVGAVPALAQTILRVDVPFAFRAEGKQMPAGVYEIVQGPEPALTIRSADGKTSAALMTVTRLAGGPGNTDELVFDKVQDINYLSEVWYSGQDGFLVLATKGPHTHARVKAAKK